MTNFYKTLSLGIKLDHKIYEKIESAKKSKKNTKKISWSATIVHVKYIKREGLSGKIPPKKERKITNETAHITLKYYKSLLKDNIISQERFDKCVKKYHIFLDNL